MIFNAVLSPMKYQQMMPGGGYGMGGGFYG